MLNLRKLRIEKQLTQKDLALKLKLSNKAISTYEKGTAVPKLTTLLEMTKILNCSLDDLLGLNTKIEDEEFEPIYDLYKKLNKKNKELLLSITKNMLDSQK